ncbi:MAG TPA: hypothetical protein VK631_20335 [Solirubrobacteraceae bacterium]|nr:hypothetical protein [Solirubrobacteraceae bacterium]
MTPTTFEERLLTELRAVVAERPAPETVAPASARRVPRARLVLAAGAVAATAAAVFVGTGGDPAATAYAVEKQSDGSVTVEVRSLRDAAGLQEKLRAAGIPAVVDYTPAGKMCREPRGRAATGGHGPMRVGVRHGGSATFTIARGDVRAGQTLVITSSVGSAVSSLGTQVVEGPVAPCELVDAPPLPPIGQRPGDADSGPSFSTGGANTGATSAGPSPHDGP